MLANSVEYPKDPLLVVDDEVRFLESVAFLLKAEGFTNFKLCGDSREVMLILSSHKVSMMLIDINMSYKAGLNLIPLIIKDFPDLPVIVITGDGRLELAAHCMKGGAFDYIVKPVDENRLLTVIRNVLKFVELKDENTRLRDKLLSKELKNPSAFSTVITGNENMISIFKYIETIAPTPFPVLIQGETGTGKELIARAVHKASERKGAFVAVNIAGEEPSLISDTLFGHCKGGFTGAVKKRGGLIEKAADGTVFLDEIGDLLPATQVKLLRVLQEKRFYPIGSDTEKTTDTRFLFATHQDLERLVQEGKFRKDLFYRLQSHKIHIPPLRERLDDLEILVDFLLEKGARILKKKKPSPPKELFTLLKNYPFPGNIRELEGLVYNAVCRHEKGVLSLQMFERYILGKKRTGGPPADGDAANPPSGESCFFSPSPQPLPFLDEVKNLLITEAMKRSAGNQTLAAKMIGVSRKTVNTRWGMIRSKTAPDEQD